MRRLHLNDERAMIKFAEENYDDEKLKEFRHDQHRPKSYPALAIWDEGSEGDVEFVEMQEFLEAYFEVLNIDESGILIIKVPEFDQDVADLEAMQRALKNLGLSALLMRKGDEVVELTHQQLVNIADAMGYVVSAKGQA